MPLRPLAIEQQRLDALQSSALIGISFLDADGKLIQEFDDDPALKEAIIEYQRERVRQLTLSELSNTTESTWHGFNQSTFNKP